MNREELIEEIWSYCKHTHSSDDYKDLCTFETDELDQILTNIYINNYE